MNEPDTVTITIAKKEYDELNENSLFLNALRACGVDNWDGYGDAIDRIEEWKKEDE